MTHKSSILVKKVTLLLIFSNLLFTSETVAQTTCKNGLGRVLYERLPNQQLQGYDDDVVSQLIFLKQLVKKNNILKMFI